MFCIVDQKKEKLYFCGGHINGIGYEKTYDYKTTTKGRKKEETERHVLCAYEGCAEEIAEYDTKEDCLQVLEMLAFVIEWSEKKNIMFHVPTKEELPDRVRGYKQLYGMYQNAAGEVSEGLKELFEVLQTGGGI